MTETMLLSGVRVSNGTLHAVHVYAPNPVARVTACGVARGTWGIEQRTRWDADDPSACGLCRRIERRRRLKRG